MFNIVRFFGCVLLGTALLSCSTHKNNPPPQAQPVVAPKVEHAAHKHEATPAPQTVTVADPLPYLVELKAMRPWTVNSPTNVEMRIVNRAGEVVKHKNFKVMHGQRVHTLIIDPSMQDYQHIHMRPENFDGGASYEFTLTPKQSGDYKIFLDVVDQKNKHYFLETGFHVPGTSTAPKFDPKTDVQVQGLNFNIQYMTPVRAKTHVMMNITVKQGDVLFRKLEPVMEAYAHLVGFNSDRSKLLHAHPMGEEPRSSNQRGGPNLNFGVEFPTAGNYRMFLQVRVNGKDIFVPIDIKVL